MSRFINIRHISSSAPHNCGEASSSTCCYALISILDIEGNVQTHQLFRILKLEKYWPDQFIWYVANVSDGFKKLDETEYVGARDMTDILCSLCTLFEQDGKVVELASYDLMKFM